MSKIWLIVIATVITANLFSLPSTFAWNLRDVFEGMSVNVTRAGNYQDQAAGYYSGGGLSMRTSRTAFQAMGMTPPSLKMSCSGIDGYMGSFSIISGQELVNLSKNIGSQSLSYAFQLALRTYAPQIENTLKDLRNLAMQLNSFAVEDCQLTKNILATGLPKDSAMREIVCNDVQAGGGRDWFKARSRCQHDMEQKQAIEAAQGRDPELLLDDYNIFIKAADKAGIPKEMREAIMSMTGTIVMHNKKVMFYDSLAKDHKTWTSYLKGGESASLYNCDNDKCLDIKLVQNMVISPENSYQGKAKQRLDNLTAKFVGNISFDVTDINFLSSIGDTFPIYDYIVLEVISGTTILENSAELIASYSLLQHLKAVTAEIKKAVAVLKSKQIEDQHLLAYLKALDQVQLFASNKWGEMMTNADRISKRARLIEQHLIARERG